MVQLLGVPLYQAVSAEGAIPGAKLFVYEVGTTTKKNTYSDSGLTTLNTNPLVADSSGYFGSIYGAAGSYKFVIAPATDTDPPTSPIKTFDDYVVTGASSFGSGISSSGDVEHLTNAQTGTSYTILTSDRGKKLTANNVNPIAWTLPQANSSTFPDGWFTTVINKGAGLLTITPTTSTIGGLPTLVLTRGQSANIYSDATNYDVEISNSAVGTVIFGDSPTAPHGYLLRNGDTIGSATSGATKAGAIYQALYHHYWNSVADSVCAVSTGRGASAIADFAANKTLTIPNDDKNTVYGAGTTTTGTQVGAENVTPTGSIAINPVTLSEGNLPPHKHLQSIPVPDIAPYTNYGSTGSDTQRFSPGVLSSVYAYTSSVGSGSSFTPTGTTTINAVSTKQLGRAIYWYVKY